MNNYLWDQFKLQINNDMNNVIQTKNDALEILNETAGDYIPNNNNEEQIVHIKITVYDDYNYAFLCKLNNQNEVSKAFCILCDDNYNLDTGRQEIISVYALAEAEFTFLDNYHLNKLNETINDPDSYNSLEYKIPSENAINIYNILLNIRYPNRNELPQQGGIRKRKKKTRKGYKKRKTTRKSKRRRRRI